MPSPLNPQLALAALVTVFLLATAPPAVRAAGGGTTSDAELTELPATTVTAAAPAGSGGGDARCQLPSDLIPPQEPLPGFRRALLEGQRPLTIVVLGSLSGAAKSPVKGVAAFPPRLQARLHDELAARAIELPVKVETVGRTRALAAELAALVKRQVLPLKPALVIWQVGRADARQGNPPHRLGQSLGEGLELLRQQGIDTILADIQFHPQFEALYRTDEYRHYVRWIAGKRDVPLLRRYEMIQHWASSGLVDLDSASDEDQQSAYGFIQECLAFQAARMIVDAAGLAPR